MHLTERIAKVKDGKVTVDVAKPDGYEVMVTVETVPKPRSLRANRYWWGALMRALSDYTGDKPKECHEWIVRRLRPKELTDPITGEVFMGRASTSEMTSSEFAELCIEVQEICSKIGLPNISPEHYWNSLEATMNFEGREIKCRTCGARTNQSLLGMEEQCEDCERENELARWRLRLNQFHCTDVECLTSFTHFGIATVCSACGSASITSDNSVVDGEIKRLQEKEAYGGLVP
jgi:hypothetical protein